MTNLIHSSEAGPLYPKINSVWKRHPHTNRVLLGDYAQPEFEYLADTAWWWYEKIDGTNIRLHWDGETVWIGGRTNNAQIPKPLFEHLSELIAPAGVWRDTLGTDPATIYGEGYGKGIQKNGHLYSLTPQFIVFDIRIDDWWLRWPDVEGIATTLGLNTVPFLGEATLTKAVNLVRADEVESAWEGVKAEGLVGRPKVELHTRTGKRIITKVKRVDYAHTD